MECIIACWRADTATEMVNVTFLHPCFVVRFQVQPPVFPTDLGLRLQGSGYGFMFWAWCVRKTMHAFEKSERAILKAPFSQASLKVSICSFHFLDSQNQCNNMQT